MGITPQKSGSNYRTIAAEAGVCVATVSLAMRNHPSIPVETRERIRGVGERLGYRRNARVAELMGQIRRNRGAGRITESAAMVWSDAAREDVAAFRHLGEMEVAVRAFLESQGFGLDVFYADDGPQGRVERLLKARGIRGVILAPLICLSHRHFRWDWGRFSVVIAGSALWRPEFHRVRFNHFEEMALILHHLRHRAKNRKIALISDKRVDARSGRAMVGGFMAHCGEEEGRTVFESNGTDRTALLRWLAKGRPDFVIIACAEAVSWVAESACEAEIILTDQFLNHGIAQYAGIRQDYARLGEASAAQLLGQLGLNEIGPPEHPVKIFLTGNWEDNRRKGS